MNNQLVVNNVYSMSGKPDPAVGISIAQIAGDKQLGLYCAKLEPFKRVGAHFHKEGVETYQIIEGAGVIHSGAMDANDQGKVNWNPSVQVRKGDVFTIRAGEVHQLENTSDTELLVVFGCPATHLGEDRIIVKGITD